ncbi:MAG: N-acyl-D-amino-acid deacylase, partial [Gammaproteobacteria bacterium]|nr:N-acyl-D-amino-acid deacylase [Gammaproteobacteria bacterium]
MSDSMYDLVIRGGTIVDGSGSERFVGDVAVRGGWIVATGKVQGRGSEEMQAEGLLVTPGFVDIHTHYDGQLIWSDRVAPSSDHGVTTVVIGNCGIGFAPCRPQDRKALIKLMEGVEDIPGAVTEEGLTWDWESFPDYLAAVERRAHDIDIGVLVPHSPIRVYAMGERALRREPANAADRATMRRLTREGLDAGALGFGTSRLAAHRSSSGDLIPTFEAEEVELTEIAQELRAADKGVFQIVTNVGYTPYEEQLPMMKRLAAVAGRPLTYTHPQLGQWREALRLLDEANEQPGVNIKAQLLPRPVGMMLGLSISAQPFCMTPSYLKIKDLPLAERVAEMRKPEVRRAILSEEPTDPTNPLIGFVRRWDRIFATGRTVNYEPPLDSSIAELARSRGCTPGEVAYDELLKEEGKSLLMLTIGNYESGSLDWMEEMFGSGNVVLGLGDGGAHYGMICDASFTTFALSYWTRDRPRGRLPIEDVMYRLTREPAMLMGLEDRGLIAEGYRANLNVIDYDKLALHKPQV